MTDNEPVRFKGETLQPLTIGVVDGLRDKEEGVLSWLGVPYAEPPVGEARWKSPAPVKPWTGIRSARRFAMPCAQMRDGEMIGSEDCLYLNVWRPDHTRTDLPVWVYVHGGGNQNGSGEDFCGDRLAVAVDGIVVSINYRLGPFGWFSWSGLSTGDAENDSGNYGLLDIFQALRWVREHISSFGGDPDNVTLAGQSAGARNILASFISPCAEGLYHKATVFSGGLTLASKAQGEAYAEKLLSKLVMKDRYEANTIEARRYLHNLSQADKAAYARGKSAEELLLHCEPAEIRMEAFPHLFMDGSVIPREGFNRLGQGKYIKVPLMLGCTMDEFAGFIFNNDMFAEYARDPLKQADSKEAALYGKANSFGSRLYAGFNADEVAEALAGNRDQPFIYVYRFAWRPSAAFSGGVLAALGSTHGADMDFWSGHTNHWLAEIPGESYYSEADKPGRAKLTHAMSAYLKRFLREGSPNGELGLPEWEPWNSKEGGATAMILDADRNEVKLHMSREKYDSGKILDEMATVLSDEEHELIAERLFKGRFFWEGKFK